MFIVSLALWTLSLSGLTVIVTGLRVIWYNKEKTTVNQQPNTNRNNQALHEVMCLSAFVLDQLKS